MGLHQKRSAPSADPRKIGEFQGAAFDDYLAARVLLLARLPVQGAILATTALEKYCKAVLAFRGNTSRGHLKTAHWNCLRNFDPALYNTFNQEFFALLRKCYSLRYPDELKPGYNLVLRSRELLAELDWTALTIHQRFHVRRADRRPALTMFDELKSKRDWRLVKDNHVLKEENRQAFIARRSDYVYECRMLTNRTFMCVFYTIAPAPSDGRFMREGMRPGPPSH